MIPDGVALVTARLVLRRRQPEQAATYRQLWLERDPRVPAHRRIDASGRPTVADLADAIRTEAQPDRPGLLAVHLRDTGEVIGYCGLVFHGNGNGDPREPELAFELLRRVHGRGYATEAGAAVIDWAIGLGYPRLWATVWDWNLASLRVLDKLGFVETGQVEVDPRHGTSLLTVREPSPTHLGAG